MAGKSIDVAAPKPRIDVMDAANDSAPASQNTARAHSHSHSHSSGCAARLKPKMHWLSKERRLYGVILIAFSFLVAELVIGFTNNALVLVADAFHITSDLIGYIVAVLCIRLAEASGKKDASQREGFSFGWQRAELLGAAFNGVFLLALGVSVVLQSVDRFINPSELGDPVLVAIIGGAGIASNLLMVALLGGHTHSHSHGIETEMTDLDGSGEHAHANHAHFSRLQPKKGRFDFNVLGVLLHVLGDGINSVAVIISAVVYLKTGWVYMDPIATLFVGCMVIGTALPLTLRTGRMLAEAAPKDIDLKGVHADVAAVEGVNGVHELHVWSLTQSKALAALHIDVASDSLTAFMTLSRKVQSCLHFWGIHAVTIQPEFSASRFQVNGGDTAVASSSARAADSATEGESTCRMRCPSSLCDVACC